MAGTISTLIIWAFIAGALCGVTFLTTRALYLETITKLRKSNSELIKEQAEGMAISPSQLAEFKRIVAEHTLLNEERNALVVYLRETFPGVGAGKYTGMDLATMVKAIIRDNGGQA